MTTRTATKSAPDDKPFDFNLDAVQHEAELRPFRVHFGGRRFEMAHLEELNIWELMEGIEQGEAGAMLAAFQAALGEEQFKEFRAIRLPQWKMKRLFDAYRTHCGVGEGESPASSGS